MGDYLQNMESGRFKVQAEKESAYLKVLEDFINNENLKNEKIKQSFEGLPNDKKIQLTYAIELLKNYGLNPLRFILENSAEEKSLLDLLEKLKQVDNPDSPEMVKIIMEILEFMDNL